MTLRCYIESKNKEPFRNTGAMTRVSWYQERKSNRPEIWCHDEDWQILIANLKTGRKEHREKYIDDGQQVFIA